MTKIIFVNIIIGILLFTTLALLYVHQEISIVKTSFLINKHRDELSFLLDRYRCLVYNLSQLESPKRIEDTLCVNEITLCVPKAENIRRLNRVDFAQGPKGTEQPARASFLGHMFDRFAAKAEAKVVK